MISVKDLWDHTLNEGYRIRKNKLNGLEGWQPLKNAFSSAQVEKFKVNGNHIDSVNRCLKKGLDVSDLTDSYIECDGINVSNSIVNGDDRGHFLVQHFRIPYLENFSLSLLKLMQIAYNAGQFKAAQENDEYTPLVVDFYTSHDLFDIRTFIDEDRINEKIYIDLPNIQSIQLGSSRFYHKYQKYKSKYLSKKQYI